MILDCQHISKSFGTDEILKDISFHINEHEKTAIVGINGAGKSTLLKIIMRILSADAGDVVLSKHISVGYLAQYQEISGTRTIFEEALSAKEELVQMEMQLREMEEKMPAEKGEALERLLEKYNRLHHEFELKNGYAYRSEVTGIIRGLGFSEEDFHRPVAELSGGQKTRVFLGKLLLAKPDLLILDEPTNHLDMSSIAWLETFLSNYTGAVLIVSHDRYFLDKIVTKVIELSRHQASVFRGNYSDYAVKKAAVRKAEQKAWENQQREIKHQEEVIAKLKSFNREKSIKRAESREKMLDKVERLDRPAQENADMKIRFHPAVTSGNDVLEVTRLAKSFGNNRLFSDISFEIKRGEHVALIGDNGTGKTTLLKIINEMIPFDAGEISFGTNVHVAYYDQEHQVLNDAKTLFEEISDEHPGMNNTQIRSMLAAFLFTEDDVFKRVGDLSGGEKGRLSLAKLMLSEANVLILDEPTNHLDIISKEILEEALNQYDGTVLFVSHDRYFINKAASRILDLTDQTVVNYIGNYDYYLEKREVQMAKIRPEKNDRNGLQKNDSAKEEWKQKKEEQAKERKKAAQLNRTEEEIAEKEAEIKVLNDELNDPDHATNSAKLSEIHERMTQVQEALERLYETWEALAEENSGC
jgi:ATP-binding cassette subfamily F protein 3